MKTERQPDFWEDKYQQNDTFWDMGQVSPPIKAYFDQLQQKDLKILIPGAGNSYEAEYLHQQGFTNVHIIDFALPPIKNFKKRVPDFPEHHIHHQDFFSFESEFDIIIEQTFFCAIPPKMRTDYAQKTHQLLKKGAYLVGLLFNFPLTEEGPPYGGSESEYRATFGEFYQLEKLSRAYNSHPKRDGKEFFIKFIKS
ncbi:MAG: SAM-dependent methyltransferase [Bacteroidota bacterium]